jgi:hypothetical protein
VEADMPWRGLALSALLLLTGCTSTIHLRHPDGRTAECGGSYAMGIVPGLTAADRDRDCVRDYQRQGFERVPN